MAISLEIKKTKQMNTLCLMLPAAKNQEVLHHFAAKQIMKRKENVFLKIFFLN